MARKPTDDPFTPPVVAETPEPLAQDPEPGKRRPGRPRKTAITARTPVRTTRARKPAPSGIKDMSTDQLVAKVTSDAHALATVFLAGLEMRDPVCFGVWFDEITIAGVQDERLRAFVERIVKMAARHRPTLEFLGQGTVLAEIAVAGQLVLPVVQTLWRHHGPNGVGHGGQEMSADEYAARYDTPQLAH